MSIQIAETTKARKTAKTLRHLEIHPQMGGGHIVKHVFQGYDHEPEDHSFNEDGKSKGGGHIANHLAKHGGLPVMAATAEEGGQGAVPETDE